MSCVSTSLVFSLKWAPICDLFGVRVTETGSDETFVAKETFFTLQSSEISFCARLILAAFSGGT